LGSREGGEGISTDPLYFVDENDTVPHGPAGKGNTCLYLRGRLSAAGCPTIAMFDDDNDLPMAAVADVSVLLGMCEPSSE
jgi:hydroxymethylpyrimidine pyrophosphatase-like HAD family hydrolase